MPETIDERAVPAGGGSYVVEPGDSISSIALSNGLYWKELWEHGDNQSLRDGRAHPHALMAGDRVAIHPLRKQQIACETGHRHRFRRRGVPSRIHFRLQDYEGKPFAGKRYRLRVGSRVYEGATSDTGLIFHYVDADQTEGSLTVWLREKYYPEEVEIQVRVSHMQPLACTTGLKTRLNHLGFYCGPEDGDADSPPFRDAVRAFQLAKNLEPNGELTRETLSRLAGEYGA